MSVIIKNSKGETAIIYKINAKMFDPNNISYINIQDLPKNYRQFLFIDDIEDSLDSSVVKKFEIIFEKFGLSCNKFNGGKVFYIDHFSVDDPKNLDEYAEPRHGQDGGVVGLCY